MEALKFFQRLSKFNESISELLKSLGRIGIDVNRINPNSFGDILKLSAQLRSEGFIEDIDIEAIEKDFEDLMNYTIEDIVRYSSIVNAFLCNMTRSMRTIERYNRKIGGSVKDLSALASMFGLSLPVGGQSARQPKEDIVFTDTEELTEEEKAKLRKIIQEFKSK